MFPHIADVVAGDIVIKVVAIELHVDGNQEMCDVINTGSFCY